MSRNDIDLNVFAAVLRGQLPVEALKTQPATRPKTKLYRAIVTESTVRVIPVAPAPAIDYSDPDVFANAIRGNLHR